MIALITPTGAREKQIRLCAEYMKRQNYEGEVLWIVVDDVLPRTSDIIPADKEYLISENNLIEVTTVDNVGGFKKDWTVIKLYPIPVWEAGQNTQARNLQAAVSLLKSSKLDIDSIFIIEDDDWYSANYLKEMTSRLKGYDVVGETLTLYYNVFDNTLRPNKNKIHASLFQTGFTPTVLPIFEKVLENKSKFIDMDFFRACRGQKVNLVANTRFSVGMKGMAGRPGIGSGHKTTVANPPRKMSFLKCMELKELIGIDYLNYI